MPAIGPLPSTPRTRSSLTYLADAKYSLHNQPTQSPAPVSCGGRTSQRSFPCPFPRSPNPSRPRSSICSTRRRRPPSTVCAPSPRPSRASCPTCPHCRSRTASPRRPPSWTTPSTSRPSCSTRSGASPRSCSRPPHPSRPRAPRRPRPPSRSRSSPPRSRPDGVRPPAAQPMVAKDTWQGQLSALGELIRSQRRLANLSLRELAERTNVSNPYLSQIERGMHEPSVRVLRSIARALNVSAETLLTQAGLLEHDDGATNDGERALDTEASIRADPALSDPQKAALLAVYRSYRAANR